MHHFNVNVAWNLNGVELLLSSIILTICIDPVIYLLLPLLQVRRLL